MAVTEEMKTNLMRTAYNMIIYEALDFTVGLFTKDGDTVSIGLGLPMFIRGMSETVKAKIKHFGIDGFSPGDILLTNDAYTTGSHLNHLTFTVPVFHEDRLVGFSCCMAHWPDVGGTLGGVTTDIFSEGLQIPIVKYARAGVVNQEIHEIIRMNVRLPERAMGDLRAQITAIMTGERRFVDLLNRYGQRQVLDCIDVLMDHSEAAARERTRSIPDGVYEAESFMDDDAVDVAKRIPIRVKVIVSGDEMTVDLTDVAKQVRGFYNSGPTTGIACAQVAFKCVTSPTDYPVNDGSFRNLKVVLPPGSIVSAVRPAPMRWWMTFPMTVVDTIFKALSQAVPEQVIAGHHADLCVALVDGFYPDSGKLFITGLGPLGGGWGAKRGEDGVSATVCINDGDTHNSPNEQFEAKYPVMVESLSLITDSGGPGLNRGGLGVETVVQALSDFNVNTSIERAVCLPWGLEGGLEGTGNEMLMRRDGKIQNDVQNAKVFRAGIKAGDAFVMRSGGGGGFGSPLERSAEKVQHDVRQGYVSVMAARDYYGVVIDPDDFSVDEAATRKQREQLVEVHRQRVLDQAEAPRRIEQKQLDTMPPGHLAVRCLLPSCCGRWHVPRGFEATEVSP
ncbi:hydantoinase B/oxoprolinase family protein [Pseudolabrys sp. FHR47]|uniref:hydantoinase B/oxoprolinase family protein n=1 Tax=Pseudolabrys sp. FHR47 TaxID=2562284 RepID=UPI001981ABF7|nr:hydantoinase B/oxoprolinase family protein [Pseudolabrys sp. FHR47]